MQDSGQSIPALLFIKGAFSCDHYGYSCSRFRKKGKTYSKVFTKRSRVQVSERRLEYAVTLTSVVRHWLGRLCADLSQKNASSVYSERVNHVLSPFVLLLGVE